MGQGKRKAVAAETTAIANIKKAKLVSTQPAEADQAANFKNNEKVLILSSRGITYRYRHLMTDLISLIPHSKKDSKLDTKSDRQVLVEVADLQNCSTVLFFEARKKQDLYLWLAKAPDGPSVKFLVSNVHTMAEMKLSGNHLKGSRPVLSFDKNFDDMPHLQLLKDMFTQTFTTPLKHHKSKPFFDHVLSFSVADGRVWLRNYQVVVQPGRKAEASSTSLIEVGPRMCLQPIKIFAAAFGGATLYQNPEYVSPNAVRALVKRREAGAYTSQVRQKERRRRHVGDNCIPRGELEDVFQ